MKYVLMLTVLLCFAGIFALVQLGAEWVYVGHGLNPWICGVGVILLIVLGHLCARQIEYAEGDE